MTHTTPRPELEPCDTERTPISPVLGWCSLCGETIFAGQGFAAYPGARPDEPVLLCAECVARHAEWGTPMPAHVGGDGD